MLRPKLFHVCRSTSSHQETGSDIVLWTAQRSRTQSTHSRLTGLDASSEIETMYSPSRPTSASPSTPSSGPSQGGTLSQQMLQQLQLQQTQQTQQPVVAASSSGAPEPPARHPRPQPLEIPQQPVQALPVQTLPVLNSINRISRTYYTKKDQDKIYSSRHLGMSSYRQNDMRRESCEVIAGIGKRIGL